MTALTVVIVIVTMLVASSAIFHYILPSYSQPMTRNSEQLWTDSAHDLKITFVYNPKIPVVDRPTELKFTVQRISTGEYLKDLEANVLITDNISGQFRNFKFNNVSAPNGEFSVNYLFPDTGLFEIITRVSSSEVQALAAFEVIVPKRS